MKSPDDNTDWEAEQRPEEPHNGGYDPLFAAWPEARPPSGAVPSGIDDGMFSWMEVPAEFERAYEHGDIAAAEARIEADYARAPEPSSHYYYPRPYEPVPRDRVTELQRRLREETLTLPRPERRWSVTVRELAETLLLAVLIFLAVRASLQNFRVEGASMEPSLENGEYLIVNKLAYTRLDTEFLDWLPFFDSGENGERYLWSAPKRGDVVVFRSPTSINRDFIKRIIGMPGDTVEIDDETGQVRVNGQVLEEDAYIQGGTHCGAQCTRVVPPANTVESRAECGSNACYYVMGDNRQNSSDSRQGWLVPEENIIGKALITYWHNGSPELDLAPNHSVGFASEE